MVNDFLKVHTRKVIFIVISLFLIFIVFQFLKQADHQPDPNFKRNKNAIWIGHKWVEESIPEVEYSLLCVRLQAGKITDVFANVGTLDQSGNIEYKKYRNAGEFIYQIKSCMPRIHIQAWIGQVEKRGGGPLDMSRIEIRDSIIQTAEIFLELGFDGIHYNIEPIYNGDLNILDLLKRTHAITKASRKILSIASDEMEPFPFAEKMIRIFAKRAGFWNKQYYLQVADNVDQIAVMMYDTGIPFANMYSFIVKHQVKDITTLLNGKVILFFGVTTYKEDRWSFHSKAENMHSGIQGISMGIAEIPLFILQNKFGIAIYSDWTTDEVEWMQFKKEWLLLFNQ